MADQIVTRVDAVSINGKYQHHDPLRKLYSD